MRMDIKTAQDNNDTGADLVGLDFMDDGTRFTITGTSSNDGIPTITYIDPTIPLKDKQEHESTVKEVRTWYNKTCLLQAANSLSSNTRTFMNDLAYETFRHLCPTKTYDVQLADPTRKAPTSYKAAGNRETQWFSAEDKEQDGILHFKTWQRLPQHSITNEMRKKALHIHLLYDVKRDGSAKNRAVANGSRQHPDTYSDTTSPVASKLQVRLHLAHIALREYHSIQMDLTNAYLHADITDLVLIIIPKGYPGEGEAALLKKGLYGTKQGSRRFYDHTDTVLTSIGFQQCPVEPCLYRLIDDHGEAFLLLYVDDALISGTTTTVTHIQTKLKQHFEYKFNVPKDLLGMDIETRTKGETSISMTTFTNKLMKQFEIQKWPYPITTPGRTDIKIQKGENPEINETYRSKVGGLNWLSMCLRFDIVYATKELSRVLSEPTQTANTILTRTLQYLHQTSNARLKYIRKDMIIYTPPLTRKKPTDIINPYTVDYCLTDGIHQTDDIPITQQYTYKGKQMILACQTDIDLGGQTETRQSTSGYILYLCGCIVHWRGHTEKLVLKSTAAGEYVALSRGNTASKHVMSVLQFYGNTTPIFYLYTDNQAAEHIATQPTMNDHSRSIDLRHHSIRQDYIEHGMRIGG